MCSATQEGLRRRRSKEETRAGRVARSETGPGNPYWKSPVGSTGGIIFLSDVGRVEGTGAGTEVVDVAETAVEDAAACAFFSERVEYIAAVTPAPVAAETAAMIAIVAFDIVKEGATVLGFGRSIYWGLRIRRDRGGRVIRGETYTRVKKYRDGVDP